MDQVMAPIYCTTAASSILLDENNTVVNFQFPVVTGSTVLPFIPCKACRWSEDLNSTMSLNDTNGIPLIGEDFQGQIASLAFRRQIKLVVGLVLIPLVCLFGSVGNTISLRALARLRMRDAVTPVLAALAVSDLLFLLHALFFAFLQLYSVWEPRPAARLRAMTFPVVGAYSSVVTARISTGLTLVLSVERLLAVYLPIRARVLCRRPVILTSVASVYIITILAFAPYLWKYRTENHRLDLTSLGKHPQFFPIYGNILNALFRLLPLLLLSVVNTLIGVAVKRAMKTSSCHSDSSSTHLRGSRKRGAEHTRVTMMLLVVSAVSLACVTPGAIHSIVAQVWTPQYSRAGEQSNLFESIATITLLLETINSSVNFLIYIAFSSKFKFTYRDMLMCGKASGGPRGHQRRIYEGGESVFRFSSRTDPGRHRRSRSLISSSSSKESCPMRRVSKQRTDSQREQERSPSSRTAGHKVDSASRPSLPNK